MALVQVDFFSEKLMRTVTINAIIPVDKKLNQPNKKFKTLYLLHGIFGNYTDWVCGTRIQRWAQDHDLAVIMPSGENKFYVDNENSHEYYSQFIGEELVSITRAMFPLSQRREDTFIAGLSMGGYGAIEPWGGSGCPARTREDFSYDEVPAKTGQVFDAARRSAAHLRFSDGYWLCAVSVHHARRRYCRPGTDHRLPAG